MLAPYAGIEESAAQQRFPGGSVRGEAQGAPLRQQFQHFYLGLARRSRLDVGTSTADGETRGLAEIRGLVHPDVGHRRGLRRRRRCRPLSGAGSEGMVHNRNGELYFVTHSSDLDGFRVERRSGGNTEDSCVRRRFRCALFGDGAIAGCAEARGSEYGIVCRWVGRCRCAWSGSGAIAGCVDARRSDNGLVCREMGRCRSALPGSGVIAGFAEARGSENGLVCRAVGRCIGVGLLCGGRRSGDQAKIGLEVSVNLGVPPPFALCCVASGASGRM
mmetsp:Transcript_166289/g.534034  ORF Transcript_166289/g.534034 Transcript_166289/m.534034 type:complete len:274 (+) Transcript_166289:1383-2204(+)